MTGPALPNYPKLTFAKIICPSQTPWPDLAKFGYFDKIYYVLGILLRVYLLFGKTLHLLWQNLYTIGRIFIAVNDQMLI